MLKSEFIFFLTIYEQLSLSKAADVLDTYQGALSKLLSKLELELGYELFLRTNRGLVATKLGHKLYKQIQLQKDLWEQYHDKSLIEKNEVNGLIRIGGHSSVLTQFTPLFSHLIKSFPKLNLIFHFNRSPVTTRKIVNHELDMAFVVNPKPFNELVIKKIKKETVSLYSEIKKPNSIVVFNSDLISSSSIIKNQFSKEEVKLIDSKNYSFAALFAKELEGSALIPESVAKTYGLDHLVSKSLFEANICFVYRADNKPHSKVLSAIKEII